MMGTQVHACCSTWDAVTRYSSNSYVKRPSQGSVLTHLAIQASEIRKKNDLHLICSRGVGQAWKECKRTAHGERFHILFFRSVHVLIAEESSTVNPKKLFSRTQPLAAEGTEAESSLVRLARTTNDDLNSHKFQSFQSLGPLPAP